MSEMSEKPPERGDEPRPVLARKGTRRNAGADTPSGPNTERSSTPAEREHEGENPNDILPSTHPQTVDSVKVRRQQQEAPSTSEGSTGTGGTPAEPREPGPPLR